MKQFYLICQMMICCQTLGLGQLSGKVIDSEGKPVSYVTVYSEETSQATISNDDGVYSLPLELGQHTIIFTLIGYQKVVKTIDFKGSQTLDITLPLDRVSMPEIVVSADAEDPAYAIIREAIKRRPVNYNSLKDYKADVYAKAMVKIKEVPDKILGNDVSTMGGILDSNRQGIIYFSESQATFYKSKPNDFKEEIHKSVVSGEVNGMTFNQYSAAQIDLYEESPTFVRALISPIADNALDFYKYRLVRSTVDENGLLVHEIDLIPRNAFRPCFGGKLFIAHDTYHIYATALTLTKAAVNNPVFDTIKINQTYAPNKDKKWILLTQSLDFKLALFVVKMQGSFLYVFSNYQYPLEDKKEIFGRELIKIDKNADTRDTNFWASVRPIPLSQEESIDYHTKDSLRQIWESKTYMDSIDRVNNQWKPIDIIQGYTYNNSYKGYRFGFSSPINTVTFNPVEGYVATFSPFAVWEDSDDRDKIRWNNYIRYGFSDQKFKAYSRLEFHIGDNRQNELYIRGGRQYTHVNEDWQMGAFAGSYFSLIFKQNYPRFYKKDFIEIGYDHQSWADLSWGVSLMYGDRNSLSNVTNQSIFNKSLHYESNLVQGIVFEGQIASAQLSLDYTPGVQYMTTPRGKINLGSPYPTLYATCHLAIPIVDQGANFNKFVIGLRDNSIGVGRLGDVDFRIEGGIFISHKNSNLPDLFHFNGGQVIFKAEPFYNNTFHLLPYYEYINDDKYLRAHVQHHFRGLITEKIPGFRKLGVHTVIWSSYLHTPDVDHVEVSFGFENIRIGPFPIGRIDGVAANTNGMWQYGFRFGFSSLFMARRVR